MGVSSWWIGAVLVFLAGLGPRAAAAQRGPAADYRYVLDALESLAAVDERPGDPNGELRAWDRRWRRRLERLASPGSFQLCSSESDCRLRAGCELADAIRSGAARLILVRADMLRRVPDPDRDLLVELATEFAWRWAVQLVSLARADEGHSCEDLPERWELRARVEDELNPFRGPHAEDLRGLSTGLSLLEGASFSRGDRVRLILLIARGETGRMSEEVRLLTGAEVHDVEPNAGSTPAREPPETGSQ